MGTPYILFIVVAAISTLLLLVLWLKINAFISLLITATFVGILSGMPLVPCIWKIYMHSHHNDNHSSGDFSYEVKN